MSVRLNVGNRGKNNNFTPIVGDARHAWVEKIEFWAEGEQRNTVQRSEICARIEKYIGSTLIVFSITIHLAGKDFKIRIIEDTTRWGGGLGRQRFPRTVAKETHIIGR